MNPEALRDEVTSKSQDLAVEQAHDGLLYFVFVYKGLIRILHAFMYCCVHVGG